VRMVQEALIALKFDLGPFGADSRFGNDTASAVRAFKKKQALGFEHIGDVGPGTIGRLDTLCP
jgi:peptidoglycan hydrolase-like protein with peptidoglycan-binding domain